MSAAAGRPTVADLYERWTLDLVSSIGPHCGTTFEAQPQRFKGVPKAVAKELAVLKYRAGKDEFHLSDEQRYSLLAPILGDSDGTPTTSRSSSFHLAAEAVRKSAVAFVERSFDTGERQLRESFRDSVKTLREYMTTVDGAVVEGALARIEAQFAATVSVLQSKDFAAGFGLPAAPSGGSWPLALAVSGDGAILVHAVAHEMLPSISLSKDQFLRIQRIAHFGATTMSAVATQPLDTDQDETDTAIGLAYRWWTAIKHSGTDAGVVPVAPVAPVAPVVLVAPVATGSPVA